MWGRLAEGKRELALEPYLRCFELLRKRDVDRLPLPGERTLKIDKATGLTPDLQPVWFDSRLAKDALEPVYQAITQMKTPRPTGVRIYFGSLALAAGDQDRAMQAIGESPYPTANLELHRQLVLAQRELAAERLAAAEALLQPLLNSAQRPQALYWLGVARTSSPSPAVRQAGLLDLLRLPASYGESQPDLSAAGLHRVMVTLNAMKDARGAVAVRRELLDGYGQTYHALKITKGKRPPPATDE
jgi:hypothetical protein